MDIITPDEMKLALFNDALCKKIGQAVFKAYPNHIWQCEVFDKGQSFYIKLPLLTHIKGIFFTIMNSEKNNIKKAVMIAGEMQERFNLSVGKSSSDDIRALNRDSNGAVLGADVGEYQGR